MCMVSSSPEGPVWVHFASTGTPCTIKKKTLPSFVEIIKDVTEIKGAAFNVISFIIILMKLYVRLDG